MCLACPDSASTLLPVRPCLAQDHPSSMLVTSTYSERTQIWPWLQELCGEREADGCKVRYANEPALQSLASYAITSGSPWHVMYPRGRAYFRKMPSRVLNLELSSGGFSAGAFEGVAARDTSAELSADVVVDPGRACSADRSAILDDGVALARGCGYEDVMLGAQRGSEEDGDDVVKCGSALRDAPAWQTRMSKKALT